MFFLLSVRCDILRLRKRFFNDIIIVVIFSINTRPKWCPLFWLSLTIHCRMLLTFFKERKKQQAKKDESKWANGIGISVTNSLNKKYPNFSKSCPKVATTVYTCWVIFFKSPKWIPNIWTTLVRKFVTKNLKKIPIWSHWSESTFLFQISCVSFI